MNSLDYIIVIPVHKSAASEYELISLRQCAYILKKHPICIVCPNGLDVSRYTSVLSDAGTDWSVVRFPQRFFDGIKGYNLLMLDNAFYKRFNKYKYMLVYQLDAWVFRDELDEWCNKGYDYIGAPWIEKDDSGKLQLTGVGNGGFSLSNV